MKRFAAWFGLISILGMLLSACGEVKSNPATPPATQARTASVSPAPLDGKQTQSLEWDGRTRTYIVHLPPKLTPDHPVPLLIALHGAGGQGRSMAGLTGFNAIADREGFIVAYPDGLNRGWNDGRPARLMDKNPENIDDVGFISALIDKLSGSLPVDTRRVYVTGMSNGGFMSNRLGCELAGKITAIAPVASEYARTMASGCSPARPLPVLLINGDADPLVPYQGGTFSGVVYTPVSELVKMWTNLDGCSLTPATTRLPDVNPNDGTRVRQDTYGNCRNQVEVSLYTVEGGGHTWPGGIQYLPEATIGKTNRDINASEIIWTFFSRYSL